MTYEQMLEAKTPVTFINEPIVEAESATARAQRLWFDRREQGREHGTAQILQRQGNDTRPRN
jgi:hypothetical protein